MLLSILISWILDDQQPRLFSSICFFWLFMITKQISRFNYTVLYNLVFLFLSKGMHGVTEERTVLQIYTSTRKRESYGNEKKLMTLFADPEQCVHLESICDMWCKFKKNPVGTRRNQPTNQVAEGKGNK